MIEQILPGHTSEFTRTLENIGAKRLEKVAPYIDAIGMKWNSPQPRLMPYLIEETGLGMLSPYVDNVYELYEQGLQWLRVRGMPVAVNQGLDFIGYSGSLETTPRYRRKWHWEQLSLDKLPEREGDLPRISGVVGLSVSARTYFSRGYNGYDFRAAELSRTKSGSAILSSHSGARIGSVPTKWSFGSTHEFQRVLTDAEKKEIGVFIDTSAGGMSWNELAAPWDEVHTPWSDLGIGAKLRVMARQTAGLGGYMGFYRSDGSLIGARRLKALHQVAPGTTYKIGSEQIAPSSQGQRVFAEALTDFGDGADEECAFVALLFGAAPNADLPQGKLWLLPDQIKTPFAAVAKQALTTDLRFTKRTRVKVLLSFA